MYTENTVKPFIDIINLLYIIILFLYKKIILQSIKVCGIQDSSTWAWLYTLDTVNYWFDIL